MIITKLLPINTKRRSGIPILGVKFIVAHDTGNPNSTAMGNVNYYINSANEMEASAHVFIDDLNIIQCIPPGEKAWHVIRNVTTDNAMFGVDANDYALGVELCYFPQDVARTQKAYKAYCEYIKELCQRYQLDPRKHVVGHFQLDPARKTDPMNAFKVIGKDWEKVLWEKFIQDISSEEMVELKVPKSKEDKIMKFLLSI